MHQLVYNLWKNILKDLKILNYYKVHAQNSKLYQLYNIAYIAKI